MERNRREGNGRKPNYNLHRRVHFSTIIMDYNMEYRNNAGKRRFLINEPLPVILYAERTRRNAI